MEVLTLLQSTLLNSDRRCKCTKHSAFAPWHGTASGWTYHKCKCPECSDTGAGYYRDYAHDNHIPAPQIAKNCAYELCAQKFEAARNQKYCSKKCAAANRGPRRYGYVERRRARWLAQNKTCALCHLPLTWEDAHLDHDHSCCDTKSKKSCGDCDRGVLHPHCNQLLGHAQDDVKLLMQAIEYLERSVL